MFAIFLSRRNCADIRHSGDFPYGLIVSLVSLTCFNKKIILFLN